VQAVPDAPAPRAPQFDEAAERIRSHTVDWPPASTNKAHVMNSIIYIVGLIVIIMAILSFIGLA
jgi:hypothetical protein